LKSSPNYILTGRGTRFENRKGLPPPPLSSSSSSTAKDKVVLVEKGTKVKYHPVFENAQLTSAKLDDVTVYVDTSRPKPQTEGAGDQEDEEDKDDGCKWLKITDLACYDEYATSPPCRSLRWEMGGNPLVKNDQGVTVEDAVVAASQMWSSECPPQVIANWKRGNSQRDFEWGLKEKKLDKVALKAFKQKYKEDTGIDPDKKLQWRETLGDHSFWEGMDEARVVGADSVPLVPKWFGS